MSGAISILPVPAHDPGLHWGNCHNVLANSAKTSGWALCVGAGTSFGPFPDWGKLVCMLMGKDSGVVDPIGLRDELSGSFSYDALIQASKDALRMGDDEFATLLQDLLYENLRKTAGTRWNLREQSPNNCFARTDASK